MLNSINIAVYVLYWTFVLFLYGMVNELSTQSSAENTFYKLLLFSVSSKGFADLFVWILIVDTNKVMAEVTGASEESLDLNQALRMEVLYYATTGIRKCAQRGSSLKVEQQKTVISMAQKETEKGNTSFTGYIFLLIMLGFKQQVSQLMVSTSARRKNDAQPHSHLVNPADRDSERVTDLTITGGSIDKSSNPLHNGHKSVRLDSSHGVGSGIPMLKTLKKEESVNFEVRESDVSVADYDDEVSSTYSQAGDTNSYYSRFRANVRTLCGSSNEEDNKVLFTEYAPYYFRKVREGFNVSDESYEDAFKTTIKERLTEGGASGAFFFFSMGEKFIAKSCNAQEMELLVENAQGYANYLGANPDSFITRVCIYTILQF